MNKIKIKHNQLESKLDFVNREFSYNFVNKDLLSDLNNFFNSQKERVNKEIHEMIFKGDVIHYIGLSNSNIKSINVDDLDLTLNISLSQKDSGAIYNKGLRMKYKLPYNKIRYAIKTDKGYLILEETVSVLSASFNSALREKIDEATKESNSYCQLRSADDIVNNNLHDATKKYDYSGKHYSVNDAVNSAMAKLNTPYIRQICEISNEDIKSGMFDVDDKGIANYSIYSELHTLKGNTSNLLYSFLFVDMETDKDNKVFDCIDNIVNKYSKKDIETLFNRWHMYNNLEALRGHYDFIEKIENAKDKESLYKKPSKIYGALKEKDKLLEESHAYYSYIEILQDRVIDEKSLNRHNYIDNILKAVDVDILDFIKLSETNVYKKILDYVESIYEKYDIYAYNKILNIRLLSNYYSSGLSQETDTINHVVIDKHSKEDRLLYDSYSKILSRPILYKVTDIMLVQSILHSIYDDFIIKERVDIDKLTILLAISSIRSLGIKDDIREGKIVYIYYNMSDKNIDKMRNKTAGINNVYIKIGKKRHKLKDVVTMLNM